MGVFGFILVIGDIRVIGILVGERFGGPGLTGVGADTLAIILDDKMHRQLVVARVFDALVRGSGF